MGKIIRNGVEYSGATEDATAVNYDNSLSGLEAQTVQEAIDELSGIGEDGNGMTIHNKLDEILNVLTPYTSLNNFNHVPTISSYISAANANTQYTHTTNFNIEEGKTYFATLTYGSNKPNSESNEISRTIDNIELIVGEYSTENADYVVKQIVNNGSYYGKIAYVIIKAKKNAEIPLTFVSKFAQSSTRMIINYEYWYCY